MVALYRDGLPTEKNWNFRCVIATFDEIDVGTTIEETVENYSMSSKDRYFWFWTLMVMRSSQISYARLSEDGQKRMRESR